MRILAAVAVGMVVGCAAAPKRVVERKVIGLTIEESRELVADLEEKQSALSKADPLVNPKSFDDALEILKRDQLDLFPGAIAYLEKQDDPKALALRAQIELAWGEAHIILSEVFADAKGVMQKALIGLQIRVASGEGTDADNIRLSALTEQMLKSDALAEALVKLSAEHTGNGIKLVKQVLEKMPDDYVGYRVAADYYRLRADWANFDAMVKKIEEKNPESNGLLFAKAAATLTRDNKPDEAAALFRKALEKDPKFTRAQAQLVVTRASARDTYAEFQKLRALNPSHQIVVWAGEAIITAFETTR